ncbi:hypothetical protein GBAR_LOCUS13139 [Geodia barretti]|uniref:Uncharacterized protein n=1 Tax=Geodia barretti TaxID=519541 RepID=A0AA35S555_GEOBA|nr:hypothetical protein GBAR_LOCUS13139 [Geodia barretti]
MTDEEIDSLSVSIKNFMAFYRANFTESTVTPKLHMLEEHVIPWLRQWRIGFGFMGEQGAESVHAAINHITPSYLNIPDRVQRLKGVLMEHHRQICPELTSCQPSVKRRKKKED